MKYIDLEQHPNQSFSFPIEGYVYTIHIYTRGDHLYMDVTDGDEPISMGNICLNRTYVLQHNTKFYGNFTFLDFLGSDEPQWWGLNNRFFLVYFTPEDIADIEKGL